VRVRQVTHRDSPHSAPACYGLQADDGVHAAQRGRRRAADRDAHAQEPAAAPDLRSARRAPVPAQGKASVRPGSKDGARQEVQMPTPGSHIDTGRLL